MCRFDDLFISEYFVTLSAWKSSQTYPILISGKDVFERHVGVSKSKSVCNINSFSTFTNVATHLTPSSKFSLLPGVVRLFTPSTLLHLFSPCINFHTSGSSSESIFEVEAGSLSFAERFAMNGVSVGKGKR